MNPENKKFLQDMFNKFPVSVSREDDAILYYVTLPDERKLAICADTTFFTPGFSIIYYTVSLEDEILEEVVVDTSQKPIPLIAHDIIDLMRLCSTKIMMQEAHLAHSKFMIHEITDSKTYS